MKKIISWIVMIPLGVLVVVFAIFNRAPVSFDLWPFAYRVEMPLFIAVFAGVVVGLVLGIGLMALALGRARRTTRAQMYRCEDAQREARYLKGELEKARTAAHEDAAGGVLTGGAIKSVFGPKPDHKNTLPPAPN